MGLLDDAIREHLELKRRSGADPSDIARLELEALGGGQPPAPEVEQAPALEETPAQPEPHEETVPQPAQETQMFSAEEVEAAAAQADGDQPGEASEFLAETPEHERLWFDQKPPKDFDF